MSQNQLHIIRGPWPLATKVRQFRSVQFSSVQFSLFDPIQTVTW